MKLLAPLVAAVALATPSSYLQAQQQSDGGWGSPQMTAWTALVCAQPGPTPAERSTTSSRTKPS